MALKNAWDALPGNVPPTNIVPPNDSGLVPVTSDAFPVVKIQAGQLAAYKQIPLAELATLGTAFLQLPEGARTVVQTVTKTVATNEPIFVGLWPKGVLGTMTDRGLGYSGNIVGTTPRGGNGIVGRMRFKEIGSMPVNETTTTVMPIDPTLMVVAVTLMTIEKKLDGIQKSVEEVLQFLKQEKQSKQRGHLNMLAEIMDDYKLNCKNERFCLSRLSEVLTIKTSAFEDIDFYENQIAAELQKQKRLHGTKDSQSLIDALTYQFAEYQLACHLYAFSTFLSVMLQQDFDTVNIEKTTEKLMNMAVRYETLYDDCHAQIAKYQRSSIEAQVIGGIGVATKSFGKAIATVPIIRKGPVDEALINAGNSLGKFNRDFTWKKLEVFEPFADNRMNSFIENLQTVNLLYNIENAMLTDGSNLYVLKDPA